MGVGRAAGFLPRKYTPADEETKRTAMIIRIILNFINCLFAPDNGAVDITVHFVVSDGIGYTGGTPASFQTAATGINVPRGNRAGEAASVASAGSP